MPRDVLFSGIHVAWAQGMTERPRKISLAWRLAPEGEAPDNVRTGGCGVAESPPCGRTCTARTPAQSGEKRPEVLVLIPARGGSKGIPRKNISPLAGKPLIAYTIEAALKSRHVTRVLVSTEDEEIRDTSVAYGAEVPFLRPDNLAGDHANIAHAVEFTLKELRLREYEPDVVAVLFTTSPFRNPRLVDGLLEKAVGPYRQVITAKPVHIDPKRYFYTNGSKRLEPLYNGAPHGQDLGKPFFRRYGLLVANRRVPGPLGVYVHRITDPITALDIDTAHDLRYAEQIIENDLFDFDLR